MQFLNKEDLDKQLFICKHQWAWMKEKTGKLIRLQQGMFLSPNTVLVKCSLPYKSISNEMDFAIQ